MPVRTTNRDLHLSLAFWLLALVAGCSGELVPDPSNQVVIMIDGSSSYRHRQQEAVDKATGLLNVLAQKRLHRWDSGADRISVVSLDAVPEVLWSGSLRALKEMDAGAWTSHFAARTDYAGCTDVDGAFALSVGLLEGDPSFVHKYLFVFSDLLHEPPTTSIRNCARASRLPGDSFQWGRLHDVSVSVFWMPPDQKLEWRRATSEHGLNASFVMYTTSESSEVTIAAPLQPTVHRTEAELQADRQGVIQTLRRVVSGAGIVFLIAIIFLAAVLLVARARRQRQSDAAPGAVGGAPFQEGRFPGLVSDRPIWASGRPRSTQADRPGNLEQDVPETNNR